MIEPGKYNSVKNNETKDKHWISLSKHTLATSRLFYSRMHACTLLYKTASDVQVVVTFTADSKDGDNAHHPI